MLRPYCLRITALVSFLFMIACQGPVMETKLDGFDKGKKTMELDYQLTSERLDSGQKGYRLKTLNHFSMGNKARRRTERMALLNEDLSMIESQKTYQSDKETTRYLSRVNGDTISLTITSPDGKETKHELQHQGPVFVELHSTRYFQDLTKPNDSKTYPVLLEDDVRVVPIKVIYVGPEDFYENNQAISSRHYKVQAASAPKEYDDYYLHPETGNILKIQFGFIKFLPARK